MSRRLIKTEVLCVVFQATALFVYPGLAQIAAPITSSGLNTQVTLSSTPPTGGVQYNITGGTRAGTNLFHSFGEFGVPTNNIANFLNDSGSATSNILSRVTSGNVSNIFGSIQTTGFGNANLFLMNPAGVVFGPTGSLNVGGSVTFTTADYLRLTDNTLFHAIPNASADAVLSTAPVAAYGFLDSNPGSITIEGGQLTVPQEHGISLVGGNITIQNGTLENGTAQPARLSAPNRQINLAATQSPGEFLQDLTAAPNINDTSFRSYGSAHLTSGSTVDFSKTGNGTVSIRGGQLVLEIQDSVLDTALNPSPHAVAPNQDTLLLAPGSSIVSRTFSPDRGPDIQFIADQLQFIGDADPLAQTQQGTPVNILARTNGSGDAGNVTLRTTSSLDLINYVQIDSSSGLSPDGTALSPVLAPGNAGNVDLTSTRGNIRMTGFGTVATSQAGNSSGTTGTVAASAPEGEILLDGANLFTLAAAPSRGGGQVGVTAQNLRMTNFGLISADNESLFKTGGITVTLSDNLEVDGSVITAFSVSAAPAGDITLTAKDMVVTRESIINNAGFASGSGGRLKVVADTLQVTGGAQLSSGSTRAPNRGRLLEILGDIKPSGPGGDITIQALGSTGTIRVDGAASGIFANTEGTGAGGNISLIAGKSVSVSNGGVISASSTGSTAGNAGNISLDAGQQLDMTNRSSITTATESPQANGGNIAIRAIDRIQVVDSTISTSVLGAEGNGGNIFIDPKVVVLQGSEVTAKAVGGAGGNITFVTPLFLADSASLVSASSERGPSGTVTIQSPTSNLSGAVGQLTAKTSPPQVLLQNRCVAKTSSEQSSFILAGRDALPADPGGWLSSPVAIEHWTGEDVEEHASGLMVRRIRPNQSPAMLASMNEGGTLSLRGLTPPGFLLRTFATGPTGCPS